jgi:hypothetical protein
MGKLAHLAVSYYVVSRLMTPQTQSPAALVKPTPLARQDKPKEA